MDIACTFESYEFSNEESLYCCYIRKEQILESGNQVPNGEHEDGKSNNDVKGLYINNCKISKVPAGFTKIFPNLKILMIYESGLKKICKDDLVEYNNIEKFNCSSNEVEYLPGDLFEGFKNLTWVEFYSNKLTVIEPNIFDELQNLHYVDFENNPNYDQWFSSLNHYIDAKSSLEDVLKQIYEKFLASDLQDIRKYLQKSKNPIETLKKLKENANSNDDNVKILELAFETIDNLQKQVDGATLKSEKGLVGDIKNLIDNDNSKDFQIQIEDKEFKVHKFLLAARSPILAETLKNNPEVENLNLVDISVDIFELVLKFIYTDELPAEGTNYLHLFAAAGRLQITDLKNHAASILLDQINDENVFEIFKLSNKYKHIELRQKAFNEIKDKYPKIKFNDGWIAEPDKVKIVIEKFQKKEEAIKKLEDEFDDDLTSLM